MASVLVLLLALFCGVYTASLPDPDALDSKLDRTLDSKLDSTTDGLDPQISDNIKQTVLEGVKKLLDSQLAAFVKDKDRNREAQRRTSKSMSSSLLSKQKEKINKEFSNSEDLQNSKLVKSYTDDDQDPGVDALTNAVDELLKDNKDIILEDKGEIILDNDVDNLLDIENSTNIDNGEIISRLAYDEIASQLVKHNKKDRKVNKSHNRKKGNRVVVDRMSKINENNRHKSEDNSGDKLNEYNENVKTLSDSDGEPLNSRKKSKQNKVRKNQIDLSESGRNLDTYIKRLDQLIKKETDSQGNKNQNVNIVHPIYQRGQKYGRRLHGPGKTLPNKYIRNGNRHEYYKLATKLPSQTVTSNIDARKSWYNDVSGKNLEQKSILNELPKFGVAQGKHETNKMNDAYSESSNESANNNEGTDIFAQNKDTVKNKLGKDKDSGKEVKKSVPEEKDKITANNKDDAKVKGSQAKNQNQANPVESDESVDEKHTLLQETEDNATTDTKDPENSIADKEENISENEEDVTEKENISSEKENVAGETKDEKETDKDYILDFLENTQNTDTNKKDTEDKLTKNEDVNVSKKDISRDCRHESDESRILRELIQNNAIKKTFSFSLNFTSQ